VAIAVTERETEAEAVPAALVEPLRADGQQPADAVERVAPAPLMAERRALPPVGARRRSAVLASLTT